MVLYNNERANRARMFYESPTMFDFSKTSTIKVRFSRSRHNSKDF